MSRRIPLIKILRGKMLKIAEIQDILILELSKRIDFVLHGGTAVWRVYGGKRFSYDVDIYCERVEEIAEALRPTLKIGRVKITPSGVLYLRVGNEVEVELEASPMFGEGEVVEEDFWLVDGGTIVVRTLSPCSLLREKVAAYLDRGKARDLYDVYYLLDLCENTAELRDQLRRLLSTLESPPQDYRILEELVLVGRPPSFETVVRKVIRFAR